MRAWKSPQIVFISLLCLCISTISSNGYSQDKIECYNIVTDTIPADSIILDLVYYDFIISDTTLEGELIVYTNIISGISPVPAPSKKDYKIRPGDIPQSHIDKIDSADRWATCYVLRMDQKLKPIWDLKKKKKRVKAWNNESYFVDNFGVAEKYRRINRVKRKVNKSKKWLTEGKITYVDKRRKGGKTARAIPGWPRKIKLYRQFFHISTHASAGRLILHELVHESGVYGHPCKKYKKGSMNWCDAAEVLVKKNPRKAKKAPYGHQCAYKHLWVHKCPPRQ